MDAHERVESVADYAAVLKALGASGLERPFWFRGHRSAAYRLRASALRNESFRDTQSTMLKRFMQDAQGFLIDAPIDQWEWLFLAQHHGVPTRLLDWSENALVALFFACEKEDPQLEGATPEDGDVWVLLPTRLNESSGTWEGRHAEDLPMFGIDESLEKYHPFSSIASQEPRKSVAALAPRSFRRISHQWGTFTITNQTVALEDQTGADRCLTRLAISADAKVAILDELRSLGIEERVVYPDLHRLGARVKEMFS